MKLFICTLLLLAINGFHCAPVEDDEDDFGERKYGIGFDISGGASGGVEVGVHAQNGTYSVFANKAAKAKANAGIGVYKSAKPYQKPTVPTPNNPYPVQYDPRYPIPPCSPYPVQYDPRYPVPPNNPQYQPYYPCYPMPYPQYQQYDIRYPAPIIPDQQTE